MPIKVFLFQEIQSRNHRIDLFFDQYFSNNSVCILVLACNTLLISLLCMFKELFNNVIIQNFAELLRSKVLFIVTHKFLQLIRMDFHFEIFIDKFQGKCTQRKTSTAYNQISFFNIYNNLSAWYLVDFSRIVFETFNITSQRLGDPNNILWTTEAISQT